jgi:hypothetical protein
MHMIARESQSVRESDFKLDLLATQSRRRRQGHDLVKRSFDLLGPLNKCSSRQRSLSGFAPQARGLLDQSGFSAVPCQQLGLVLRDCFAAQSETAKDLGLRNASR